MIEISRRLRIVQAFLVSSAPTATPKRARSLPRRAHEHVRRLGRQARRPQPAAQPLAQRARHAAHRRPRRRVGVHHRAAVGAVQQGWSQRMLMVGGGHTSARACTWACSHNCPTTARRRPHDLQVQFLNIISDNVLLRSVKQRLDKSLKSRLWSDRCLCFVECSCFVSVSWPLHALRA